MVGEAVVGETVVDETVVDEATLGNVTQSAALHTANAAQPGGHYSQAVRLGETLYISGQLPVRPDGSHSYTESFETQVNIALENLISIMEHAGCGLEDLVKATVYIVGIENWPQFNALYAQRMGNVRPARAIVPVPALHHGYLIEIEGIAHCRQQ